MIHHVYACKSNIGDWLSARAIQKLVQPAEIVELLCDEPFVPRTLERLRRVGEEDFIVIGGGGLFMDYFMPFWEGFDGLADRVRFGIWGAGYCDQKRLPSLPSCDLLRSIVRKSAFCGVRDRLTVERLGLDAAPVPCPSMAVIRPPEAAGFGLLHVIHYDVVGAASYEHTHAEASAFAEATGRPYRQIDNLIEQETDAALDRLLGAYAAADLIVTSRLHGCILGLAMGRKVLAVSGDRKIDAFMELAGLSEWVCSPSDHEGIARRLRRLPDQVFPAEFVAAARRENERIGQRIRQLASLERMGAIA